VKHVRELTAVDITGDFDTRSVSSLHGFAVEGLCTVSAANYRSASHSHYEHQISF